MLFYCNKLWRLCIIFSSKQTSEFLPPSCHTLPPVEFLPTPRREKTSIIQPRGRQLGGAKPNREPTWSLAHTETHTQTTAGRHCPQKGTRRPSPGRRYVAAYVLLRSTCATGRLLLDRNRSSSGEGEKKSKRFWAGNQKIYVQGIWYPLLQRRSQV